MARARSRSTGVGAVTVLVASLVILAACYGLKAVGDGRSDEAVRGASGGSTLDTAVELVVRNTLPVAVSVDAVVADRTGWTGTKPSDPDAFGNRTIAAGASHVAELVFSTLRSKVPFTLTVTVDGAALDPVSLDRDHLKETCTSIKQGKYTVRDCSQVNVWWLAPSSVWNDTRILGSTSSCPTSKNSAALGEYTDTAGKKQRVTITVTCSSTSGATTGTLTQTAVTGS